jgi:hypothetical protein
LDGDFRSEALPQSTGGECVLNFPLPTPDVSYSEGEAKLEGFIDGCGSDEISGWACRVGSGTPVTVGVQLTPPAGTHIENLILGMSFMQDASMDPTPKEWSSATQTFLRADLPREPIVASRCESAAAGYGFRMPLPRGDLHIRVLAYDNWGGPSREIGTCFRRDDNAMTTRLID